MNQPVWRMCLNSLCAAEFSVNVQRPPSLPVSHCPFCGDKRISVIQGSPTAREVTKMPAATGAVAGDEQLMAPLWAVDRIRRLGEKLKKLEEDELPIKNALAAFVQWADAKKRGDPSKEIERLWREWDIAGNKAMADRRGTWGADGVWYDD